MESRCELPYRSVQNELDSDSDSSDSDSSDDVWKRRNSKKRPAASLPKIKDMDTNIQTGPSSPTKVTDKLPLSSNGSVSCALKRRKLNNVWCNVLQEQTVAEDLTQVGLKPKVISFQDRSCESYDFTLSQKDPRRRETAEMEDCSKDDCDEAKISEESTENSEKNSSQRQWPKSLRESNDVVDKVAKKIIRVLSEPKHHIIYKTVQVIGSEKALELLKETEKIEDDGGMFVLDNSRRRTPGGTYLQLLKKDTSVSKKKKNLIFAEDRKMFCGKPMKKPKHSKKKKKKNTAEKMEIVFEPNGGKMKEFVEKDNSSNDSNASLNGTDGSRPESRDGSSDINGVADVPGIEHNICTRNDSEREEGEITE